MKVYFLIGIALLAFPCDCKHSHEQRGQFVIYKLTPRSRADITTLQAEHERYENHPPVFLFPLRVNSPTYVLIEVTKMRVFEGLLKTRQIKASLLGESLVEKILVKPSNLSDEPSCECEYEPQSGCVITRPAPNGYCCKCIFKGPWMCAGIATPC